MPESGEHILAVESDPRILERHALRAKPYVLAVGTTNPRKKFGAVARAIELVGDAGFDFVVAGGVDPRVFSGAGVPLPAFVKRVGYVTDAELRALYEHAACFVYPSLYEGFGLPPLEAMACGCAVIVSDAASLPEICGDAAIYCDPRSPEDIAGKLAALMADGERRRELAERGHRHAAQFSWRRTALRNWEEIVRLSETREGRSRRDPGARSRGNHERPRHQAGSLRATQLARGRRPRLAHCVLGRRAGPRAALQLYPQADLFAVIDFLPEEQRRFIGQRHARTTFIQRLPAREGAIAHICRSCRSRSNS